MFLNVFVVQVVRFVAKQHKSRSACTHFLKHEHSYILHSDLNSSAVFPTMMIGSGVALAARGLCVHCQRLRSGSVEVRQLECIQSLLEEGTGLSDKTKAELKEQISQIELQQKAEEARCPVRLSFAQIAEAREKQQLRRRRQEEDEKLAKEAREKKCSTRLAADEYGIRVRPVASPLRYNQAHGWSSGDFYKAVSDDVRKWAATKLRSQRHRQMDDETEESDCCESDDDRDSSPQRTFIANLRNTNGFDFVQWQHCRVQLSWSDIFTIAKSIAASHSQHYIGVSRFIRRRCEGSQVTRRGRGPMLGHKNDIYTCLCPILFQAVGVTGVEQAVIREMKADPQVCWKNRNKDKGGGAFSHQCPGFLYIACV